MNFTTCVIHTACVSAVSYGITKHCLNDRPKAKDTAVFAAVSSFARMFFLGLILNVAPGSKILPLSVRLLGWATASAVAYHMGSTAAPTWAGMIGVESVSREIVKIAIALFNML